MWGRKKNKKRAWWGKKDQALGAENIPPSDEAPGKKPGALRGKTQMKKRIKNLSGDHVGSRMEVLWGGTNAHLVEKKKSRP